MQLIQLREVEVNRLDSLFKEEIATWIEQLNWDYSSTLKIIRRFIASRSLPGYALVNKNESSAGYCYFISHQTVGFLGDIFVSRRFANPNHYSRLIDVATTALIADQSVDRIECQVFPFNQDCAVIFADLGYSVLERYFMVMELDRLPKDSLLPETGIRSWNWQYLVPASKVIYDSYVGSPDFHLCRDYQSSRGCLRFLRNLVENSACGVFVPDETLIAFNDEKEFSGILLATRISSDTGMIPQISVRRRDHGKGIGTRLLRAYLKIARKHGMKRVALSVSAQNQGAYRLYERLGFQVRKKFHAFIWRR